MRCAIAKNNPVVMKLAMAHYLNSIKRTESPVFCFKSLYSDNEPYPLAELLICLNERIKGLEREFKAYPTDVLAISLDVNRRKFKALLKVQEQNDVRLSH